MDFEGEVYYVVKAGTALEDSGKILPRETLSLCWQETYDQGEAAVPNWPKIFLQVSCACVGLVD